MPPPAVRAALEAVLGQGIGHVRVIERSWFAWLHWGAVATTRRGRIYLRGSAESFFANPELMLHEYCHVLRQWECGSLTAWRYVAECCRRGYRKNRYEVEARAFARTHLARLARRLAAAERASTGSVAAARSPDT